MDTTEKYIKMCEKAGEIQKNHHWQAGDWHMLGGSNNRGNPRILGGSLYTIIQNSFYNWERESIWLPRQDQLQEMVGITPKTFTGFIKKAVTLPTTPDSFEQLWLHLVMSEEYGKVWDEEKGEWNPTPD